MPDDDYTPPQHDYLPPGLQEHEDSLSQVVLCLQLVCFWVCFAYIFFHGQYFAVLFILFILNICNSYTVSSVHPELSCRQKTIKKQFETDCNNERVVTIVSERFCTFYLIKANCNIIQFSIFFFRTFPTILLTGWTLNLYSRF